MSIIETLRRAETDDKVKAVLVRLPEGGMAPASADELRLAFKHFRAVGKKPIFAHSQGLYPSGLVTSTYMLGSAASEFWMQPDSSLQAVGASSEEMFFKRFFDKYGVKAEYEQRYEYKNAVNPYLYSDYTPAHRESTLSWMGSVYTTALTTAAQDRKIDPAALIKTIEAGPYSAQEAKAKGLIDRVGQVKDAQDAMLARAGKGAKLLDFDDYVSRAKRAPPKTGPTIAVVSAEGAIMTGSGEGGSPFGGDSTIYSDQVAKALYDAIDDKDVKAIVFRVSSPGGSDTASEQILAAVKAARKAGKPSWSAWAPMRPRAATGSARAPRRSSPSPPP
jgi:protease-4